MTVYDELAIDNAGEFVFGRSPKPVACGFGLTIGGGRVYPEVNFTLPAIAIEDATWQQIVGQYNAMAKAILGRAVGLKAPGVVLEFELLPAMTERPEWGAEITTLLHQHLEEAHEKHGLKSALRVTPTDIRDQVKPPVLRSGDAWEKLRSSFEQCIAAGADIISVESVGGKEVHDQALVYGEIPGLVFALGALACRDMQWLWGEIVTMCAKGGAVPGGDTACGFANTAMQLAHQRMLPEVLVAVVRSMAAVRSLAAYEQGAVGPSKDCAYEGPIIKAITGCPISMEGKSASCAHFSPLGNISSAVCDLWSNESVQNVRLLSGSAPEAFAELLVYDCRMMNTSIEQGNATMLRDMMVSSDQWLSPQAAVMSPEATLRIATAIIGACGHYARTLAAGNAAIEILREALAAGHLNISAKELQWLDRIDSEIAGMPEDEGILLEEMSEQYGELYDPASYGI